MSYMELYSSREIRIRPDYTFWESPIRWFRERRMRRLLDRYANHWWENGGRESAHEAHKNIVLYGRSTGPTPAEKKLIEQWARAPKEIPAPSTGGSHGV